MPGFVAVSALRPSSELSRESLAARSVPLVFNPDQSLAIFLDTWFGAAVVDYGEGFSFVKPACARTSDLVCVMAGEVFPDAAEVPPGMLAENPCVQRAEYLLHKYAREGTAFAQTLNGSFAAAIIDRRARKVLLVSDRMGSLPLYYAQCDGHFAFATQLRSLLVGNLPIGRHYAKDAIAELVLTERVWADRTLFSDIKRVPAGTCLTWSEQGVNVQRYWDFAPDAPSRILRNWKDASDALLAAVQTSVKKRTSDYRDSHVLVSGGLDSRLILGCTPSHVSAVTFTNEGAAHSSETIIAQKVSATLGRKHHLVPRSMDHYVKVTEHSPNLVEGMYSFAGAHSIGIHDQLKSLPMRVAITGNWFDLLLKQTPGDATLPHHYPAPPNELLARQFMRLIADSQVFHRVHHQDLLMLAFSAELREHAAIIKERFISLGCEGFRSGTTLQQHASILTIRNIGAKPSGGFGHGLAQDFVHRCIAIDNRMLDLALLIPNPWKADGRLVRRAIARLDPRLGRLPDANTGVPAYLCPPWSTAMEVLREGPRDAARFVARRVLRMPPKARSGTSAVFNKNSSWHNNDGLLHQCPRYRELVKQVVSGLPAEFFDAEAVMRLLENDVQYPRPRFRKLFEAVLTFGLFDRTWGPTADRTVSTPILARMTSHDLTEPKRAESLVGS